MKATIKQILKGEVNGYFLPFHYESEQGIVIWGGAFKGASAGDLLDAANGRRVSTQIRRVLELGGKLKLYADWHSVRVDADYWDSRSVNIYNATDRVCGGASLVEWCNGAPVGRGGSTFRLSRRADRDGYASVDVF